MISQSYFNLSIYLRLYLFTGKLLRNKGHIHNKISSEAIFFQASPDELGLLENLLPEQPYKTVDINKAGFDSHEKLKAYLEQKLSQAGERWDLMSQGNPATLQHSITLYNTHNTL